LARIVLTAATACAVVAVTGVPPWVTLAIALAGIVIIAVREQHADI
jgi:hypothetical protein